MTFFQCLNAFSPFITAGIFDAYVPPEGDARLSSLSKEGLAQKSERLKKKVASQLSYVSETTGNGYYHTNFLLLLFFRVAIVG